MMIRHTTPMAMCCVLILASSGCKPPPQREGTGQEATAEKQVPKTVEDPMVTDPPAEGDIPAPSTVAAPPEDAERTPSGLAHKLLSPGTGTEHPGPRSQVTVHYTGWTTDGKMFDSSVKRKKVSTFPLDRVIPGWGEGVQLMVQGERRRFWVPEELAYKGRPDRPQGMLVFDVELVAILSK